MNVYLIGTIINILLLVGAGVSIAMGFMFFYRKRNAGIMRALILVEAIAAAEWGICYGIIGFTRDVEMATLARTIGLVGIDVFMLAEFWIVTSMTNFSNKVKKVLYIISSVIMLVDYILYSRPHLDSFYLQDGFMTWIGIDCVERSYHKIVVMLIFVTMAVFGVIAYRKYEFKRQKNFLARFYITNLLFMASSTIDTFYVLGYPFPTSGLGAMICAIVLCIGTSRSNAFGISSSDIYDKIYDFMNDGILLFDNNKKLVYANAFAISLMNDEKYRGKELADIFEIEESEHTLFDMTNIEGVVEQHIKLKNSIVWCNVKSVCIKDSNNETYCYLMSTSDISKEIKMLDELKQANEAKSHFLTSVSHEIRTPINTVLGMNEMIKRECDNPAVIEYSKSIDKSGHQLLTVINDILDYTKIESGGFELFNTSYDVTNMINGLYTAIKSRTDEKNLDFILKVNPEVPSWLYGDEDRVNQIIINLISNAIKYTDEGFVTLECDYEEIDNDNISLKIAVRDSGRGIKNVKNSNLYDSFKRLDEKKNRTIEGIGLGLALIKSILDHMNGTIEVESIYGVGTRFVVTIPQRISNRIPVGNLVDRIETSAEEIDKMDADFTTQNARILVVDDVEMNLIVVKELLRKTNLEIDLATSGKDALAMCQENKYNLILMDHMMPEMDGIECLKAIRKSSGQSSSAPVVVLTANAIVGARDMYLNEGFDDYLTKPLEAEKLEETIKKFI